jgi:sterol desaturase/sphingolipid hydroxylase (fatty acid hydroxylase superfamily)
MEAVRFWLMAGAVFIPVEYLFALRPGPIFRTQSWVNVALALFNTAVLGFPMKLLAVAVIVAAEQIVPQAVGSVIRGQPLWLQVVEAVLIGDFGIYVMHRALHSPALWRYHAVHHSAEEMDWLVAIRFHPIELILMQCASVFPLFILGFSAEALAFYGAVYAWQSLLIHSNTRLRLGPLRYIFVGPDFHHWHHANKRAAYDKNFASIFAFWDVLFGTLHLPASLRPKTFGVDEPMPTGPVDLLRHPFRHPSSSPTTGRPGSVLAPGANR